MKSITVFIIGVIAIAGGAYWLSMGRTISRPSTPTEIEAQLNFQEKLIAEQEEFQNHMKSSQEKFKQQFDTMFLEEKLKLDTLLLHEGIIVK